MITINNYEDYKSQEGKDLGPSQWHVIDQRQINLFADATLDHQWIHVDEEKAARDGRFKVTIAHGYLTLSLIPYLWKQIVDVRNLSMEINYGIENLRFAEPVLVNDAVQLTTKVKSITNLRGTVKATIQATLLIKDKKKPAYVGDVVFLYHFND